MDNASDKTQKIIARINQLRAISRSTHSRAEAETCITLATKLIAEYQLSEAQFAADNGKASEDIDLTNEHIIYETGRTTPWKAELVWGIAKLNGLYAYHTRIRGSKSHKGASRYRVIGRPGDIEIAKYMFDYLTHTISELSLLYVPKTDTRGVNPERESWSLGCVRGFLSKMNAERDAVNKLASSTALVFIGNKVQEAEEAFKSANPNIKWGTLTPSKAKRNESSYNSGFIKGKTLSVNKAIDKG